MATLQVESTEYLFLGVTGDAPSVGAEVAFMPAGDRPLAEDWDTALVIPDDTDPLWPDAVASGVTGDYFVARLVGPFNANPVTLTGGDYQVWLRLTDTDEQPVRIAPQALEVSG
ncbi:hypothetical protein [Jiangella asiatica]|uniref:Uncharacterized protein n=1 Tax=Jiangella asiatica TaxID=2530372 RepID=A0A4V2Z0Y6_9ACTN|nr:hypothetical protein [Jiangella asiatica]TDE02818.1 hypothetical protein E1269_21240 [Jiangella asiatica]